MIIYNTTFHIDKAIVAEALKYFKEEYIPKATASGFLHTPGMLRVMQTAAEEEGHSYSVQFRVKNVDTLNFWLQNEGMLLHKGLVNRFGHQVAGFSTLLEEVDL